MKNRFEELVKTDLPRFWDTFRKEMVYPQLVGNRVIFYHVADGEAPRIMKSLCDMLMNPRFIRMRPTGMNDKLGKTMYEKDIVQKIITRGAYLYNREHPYTIDELNNNEDLFYEFDCEKIIEVIDDKFEENEENLKQDYSYYPQKVYENKRYVECKVIKYIDVVTLDRFPKYWLENEDFGYEGEGLQDPEDYEIIGNIHENPELLGGVE